MEFDELLFCRALMDRPADAKRFSQFMKPEWLKTVEYRILLDKIYEFTKTFSIPPSVETLRKVFQDEDSSAYNTRYKDTIDQLAKVNLEQSEVLYCLDAAKKVGIVWSLETMFNNPDFIHKREQKEGSEVMHDIQEWITQFEGTNEDVEMRIDDAVEHLIKERGWMQKDVEIPCGIEFIDEWCGGGLRPKQLGLILAPTGHGKSTCLMVMAQKMALLSDIRVLFISNELSMGEITERFGAMISGEDINTVIHEPTVIRKGIETLTKWGYTDRLWLVEVNREISSDDIEGMMARYINLYGWKPDVVIIDFMERMKPTVSGHKRDETWNWYGAIAQDLIRFAKRTNTLIWTAGQTNRSGMNNKVEQGMAQAQGSIKHLQECSAVIAMRQRSDFDNEKKPDIRMLEFLALKMRHSKRPENSLVVEANLGKMSISKNYHSLKEWQATESDGADKDLPSSNKEFSAP
jgi:replicative DNA helicase